MEKLNPDNPESYVFYNHAWIYNRKHNYNSYYFFLFYPTSITALQDTHKLVLQIAEWLTASLSGLARHELTT